MKNAHEATSTVLGSINISYKKRKEGEREGGERRAERDGRRGRKRERKKGEGNTH